MILNIDFFPCIGKKKSVRVHTTNDIHIYNISREYRYITTHTVVFLFRSILFLYMMERNLKNPTQPYQLTTKPEKKTESYVYRVNIKIFFSQKLMFGIIFFQLFVF